MNIDLRYCGKMKTLFYYYYCNKGCKERYKASLVNGEFEKLISTLTTNEQTIDLFGVILKSSLRNRNTSVRTDIENIQKDICKQELRLKNAKEMVLDGEITSEDYKRMKSEIEKTLERLISDESKLRNALENYGGLVDKSLDVIKELETCYKSRDAVVKQRIIGALYPEKLVFEKSGYRTPKPLM